ncbi:FecR family protein [Mucilaginibacter gynuensis]|uniref:FecR family protein n=1 Tax=Mucilaginibacter gynuensis TaxID=1302236 RepID=A0ABP8GZL8_9SPHI
MMDELLAKYMLGETTAAEGEAIAAWIAENEENRKRFDHFKLIWDTSKSLKTESKLDADQSWTAFRQLAARQDMATAVVKPMHASRNRWMRIAAAWIVILGAAALLYTLLKPGKPMMLTLQTIDKPITDTLADGSIITLNKNSALSYPEKFTGDIREVRLKKGEAFFDIAHDKSKPFMIKVNDVLVQVVGTSFNIKGTGNKTEVIVATGIVQVIKKKLVIRLKPKESVTINNGSAKYDKALRTDELYNYYRTRKFIFNNTPLWRVAQVLNEAYNVNIVVPDKRLGKEPFTATLNYDSLAGGLKVINDALLTKAVKQGDKIIIQKR